ncbi:MAG TPA: carboxypeptidase regulatory-like domain-containing protein [Gemmatimonadaceae bacterium]
MQPVSLVRRIVVALLFVSAPLQAQRVTTGDLAGVVVSETGKPVPETTLQISKNDGSAPQSATTDASGMFRLRGLEPGFYRINARRIGFREAQLQSLRIVAGQTTEVRVLLAASPTQLSTVEVRVTATSIDATTTEIARHLDVAEVSLVPMARDANSLVGLVPGAAKGFVWGGASDATNNYKLDGVSVNHPGTGGDFLSPSIDWIDALEVRGLGAGAEYGDFQGGIINAITKTGTNDLRGSVRANYISPGLTASNIQPNEEGAEQNMRREISAEMSGPLVHDRLFYFIGGLIVDHNVAVPDLTTAALDDTRPVEQEFRDRRGIAKLTFRPSLNDRFDALFSRTQGSADRAELNGLDDPASAINVSAPTNFYELAWSRTMTTSSLDARVGGFNARESRLGYEGDNVPGVRIFTRGRQPQFQNAPFNTRVEPRSIGGNITWRKQHTLGQGENRIAIGAEYNRGYWKAQRTRNGGLTWLPYLSPATGTVDPLNAPSWFDVASEWGGETHLNSDVENLGVFVQDYLTPVPNLTIIPGVRFGRWSGWLTPHDSADQRFLAARDNAIEPRIGVVWDVSKRNDLVVKAHWGQFHQAMNSVFFDRAEGGDVYTNQRFYAQGPNLESSRRVYTPAERDAKLANPEEFSTDVFSLTYQESILNEAGRVENYKQPYIQQAVMSIEKRFGPRWKAELTYTNRINKNIVGLVDRNLATNYSQLHHVAVRDRVTAETAFDQYGDPLILETVWVSNKDVVADLLRRQQSMKPLPPTPGFTYADIGRLKWDPDIVLTTVEGGRRTFNQLSAVIRTEQPRWNASTSFTYTRLRGNIAGLNGFGSTGSEFSAGAAVRPNEAINFDGYLPDFPSFESKTWVGGELLYGIRGGAFLTTSLGNYFAPSFQINPRFRFQAADLSPLDDALFDQVRGQTILLEERGSRKYQSRINLDLRAEKQFTSGNMDWFVTADLFNATASDAIVERNLTINNSVNTDPTSIFAAPRRRVNPMALQVGLRLEF